MIIIIYVFKIWMIKIINKKKYFLSKFWSSYQCLFLGQKTRNFFFLYSWTNWKQICILNLCNCLINELTTLPLEARIVVEM